MSNAIATAVVSQELGRILYWNVRQDIRIDVDAAQAVAEANGFEASDFPAPSRVLEVSRTAKSFRHQHGKDEKSLQEVVRDNAKEKVWGLLGIQQEGEDKVSYKQDTTVRFDKETKAVTASGVQGEEFMKRFNQFKNCITDEDVRKFVNRVRAMCHGVNLRQGTGGIYFIPERFVGIMTEAQKVLDDLRIGAKIYLLPMQNTTENRQAIWESVEHEIGKDVNVLVAQANNITRNVSSFKKKDDKLKELDSLMTVYRNLLGAEAQYEELAERLQEASGQVAELMTELQSTKRVSKLVKAKKAKTASSGQPATVTATNSGTKPNKWVSAAVTVLAKAGTSMHYTAIAEQAIEEGLIVTNGKTPERTLNSAIGKYNDGRVIALGKGVYELANA